MKPHATRRDPFVYILILNWNGWQDTIECLESVFRINHGSYKVVVCDNGSEDDSLQRIKDWADGSIDSSTENSTLRHLSYPPVDKPIPYVQYDRQAELGGSQGNTDAKLILIQTGANLGFAGGNNVGLRYVLSRDDFDFVWLLNNDTVVEPDSLTFALKRMAERTDAGICGSRLVYYHHPERTQAFGGADYDRWFGVPKRIEASDLDDVEQKLAYVVGASMLVSRAFLRDIGLLGEEYFLCFEEIDWATRARRKYGLCFASKSIVYHKDGNSLGHPDSPDARSYTADYYNIGNRLVFTRKFYPWAVPTVYLGLIATLFNRLRRGQWDRVKMVISLIIRGRRRSVHARQ